MNLTQLHALVAWSPHLDYHDRLLLAYLTRMRQVVATHDALALELGIHRPHVTASVSRLVRLGFITKGGNGYAVAQTVPPRITK